MEISEGVHSPQSGLSRRELLRAGSLGVLGAGMTAWAGDAISSDRSVIYLSLVGGPSQLDTFDPKPDASAEIRGPFRSIATSLPGVRLGEYLPLLARRMDRVALVRSMNHDADPIHETGRQLLETGRLCRGGDDFPHFGTVVARSLGSRGGVSPFAILPGPAKSPIGRPEPAAIRDSYGPTAFGRSCLEARRLVEAGTRVVVVNMYGSVHDGPSWDCHGSRGFASLDDYASEILPSFDRAYSALIDDLHRLGRLDSTLVVATGEFGRNPRLNAEGGRDHWPGVWTALLAGGGVCGGRVIGRSDRTGGEPADRPVRPEELLATIYASLGLAPGAPLDPGNRGSCNRRVDASPIRELYA
jgi:hypothetical protein